MAKSKLSPLRVRDGLFLPCPTRALSVFLCCCLVHSGVCFPPFTPTQSKIIRITSSQRKRLSPPFPFFSSSPSLFPLSPSFFPPTPSFVNSSVAFFGRPQSRKIFQLAVSFPAPLFNPRNTAGPPFRNPFENTPLCNSRRGAKSPTLTTCSPGGLISRLLRPFKTSTSALD